MKISKDIIDIFEEIIKNDYDNTHPTRIRPEIEYFKGILNLLNNSLYWSRYNHNISGKLLNNKHHEYIRKGYYNKLVKTIIEMYINTQDYYIFKFLSTDTSFIPNKYCTKVGRNKFYRNKKRIKIIKYSRREWSISFIFYYLVASQRRVMLMMQKYLWILIKI